MSEWNVRHFLTTQDAIPILNLYSHWGCSSWSEDKYGDASCGDGRRLSKAEAVRAAMTYPAPEFKDVQREFSDPVLALRAFAARGWDPYGYGEECPYCGSSPNADDEPHFPHCSFAAAERLIGRINRESEGSE